MPATTWSSSAVGPARAAGPGPGGRARPVPPAWPIPWDTPIDHPDEVEAALVQILTYLVENELAALTVPSRFIARIHPHYREVVQLLAVQCADEARHVEVFARRAGLRTDELGPSGAGGWSADRIATAWRSFLDLQAAMDEGRRGRLVRLGFSDTEAADLSRLHTDNFM